MTSASPARVLNLLAVFFIVLGTVWFSFIQSRCYEISPRPAFAKATAVETIAQFEPKKVRSPHATPWHDRIFFTITTIEVFASIFYVLAGLFILRRFVLTKFAVTLALGLHVLLMIFVIGFMKLGAIPLSDLTHNPNLLQLYYLPSYKVHNLVTVYLTGYKFYLPGGPFYLVGVVLYFYLCYFIFAQPAVKNALASAKTSKV